MKSILIALILLAAGTGYIAAYPPSFTVTLVEDEEVIPAATTTASVPKQTPTPKPTPKPAAGSATAPRATTTPPVQETPASVPQKSYATQIEELVLEKTNAERIKNNLPPLTADAKLAPVARAHSADMQAHNYFSHEDAVGCDSSCRVDAAGYTWSSIGENIYMMSGFELTANKAAEKVVQGWMNSPGHRANILRESYTHSGVGVVAVGEDIYITALYSKPR